MRRNILLFVFGMNFCITGVSNPKRNESRHKELFLAASAVGAVALWFICSRDSSRKPSTDNTASSSYKEFADSPPHGHLTDPIPDTELEATKKKNAALIAQLQELSKRDDLKQIKFECDYGKKLQVQGNLFEVFNTLLKGYTDRIHILDGTVVVKQDKYIIDVMLRVANILEKIPFNPDVLKFCLNSINALTRDFSVGLRYPLYWNEQFPLYKQVNIFDIIFIGKYKSFHDLLERYKEMDTTNNNIEKWMYDLGISHDSPDEFLFLFQDTYFDSYSEELKKYLDAFVNNKIDYRSFRVLTYTLIKEAIEVKDDARKVKSVIVDKNWREAKLQELIAAADKEKSFDGVISDLLECKKKLDSKKAAA